MSSSKPYSAGLAIIASVAFATAGLAADISLSCPESITTKQSAVPREGWDSSVPVPDRRHLQRAAGINSGPPADQADLRPRMQQSRTEEKAIYDIEGNAPDGYWLVCFFDDTRVVLSKRLPSGLRRCEVTHRRTPWDAQYSAVKSIVCK